MTLDIARRLCNLPKEWEGLEFSFCMHRGLLYVAHPELPPVAIDDRGKLLNVAIFEGKLP